MNNSDQNTEGPISFYEKYLSFSDNQIKEILRNHKNYQESAVTAAVKIAIERELIHNEQDLLAPEYQNSPIGGFSFFPQIINAYHYKKVVASIFRVLFIVSLLPIIFGALKYAEGQFNMSYLGFGLGFTWLVLTFLLYKGKKLLILNLQIILLIFVSLGLGYRLFNLEFFRVTDMVMLVIGTTLILYFLLHLRKLIQVKPDPLSGH
jgi:hypothetical protein